MKRNNLPPNYFECLIPEIKSSILHSLPDIRTLSALIHASPSFHAAYIPIRCEILTSSTFKTLRRRGVHAYMPACFAQITLRNTKYHPYYQPQSFPYTRPSDSIIQADKAFVANIARILRQIWIPWSLTPTSPAPKPQPKPKLSVEDCIALLQIMRYTCCPLPYSSSSGRPKTSRTVSWNPVHAFQEWYLSTALVREKKLQAKEVMYQHLIVFDERVGEDERGCIENLYERWQMGLVRELRDLEVYGRDRYIN